MSDRAWPGFTLDQLDDEWHPVRGSEIVVGLPPNPGAWAQQAPGLESLVAALNKDFDELDPLPADYQHVVGAQLSDRAVTELLERRRVELGDLGAAPNQVPKSKNYAYVPFVTRYRAKDGRTARQAVDALRQVAPPNVTIAPNVVLQRPGPKLDPFPVYGHTGEDEPLPACSGLGLLPKPDATDEPIVIAILDDGLTVAGGGPHLDRLRDYAVGYGPQDEVPVPRSDRLLHAAELHGMFIAGLAMRHAGHGRARFSPVKVADDAAGPSSFTDVATLVNALDRLAVEPPAVINMSFGTGARDPDVQQVLRQRIDQFHSEAPDTVFVAAAGNHGTTREVWPAAFPEDVMVAVGAVTKRGSRASWSSHGDWVDVTALGENVTADYLKGTYTFWVKHRPTYDYDGLAMWSGTSFSAAIVSGLIVEEMQKSGMPASQAYQALKGRSAKPGGPTHEIPLK
jgi:hypothetical protein